MSEITSVLAKIANKIGSVETIQLLTMDGAVVASYPEIPPEQADKVQKYYYNMIDAMIKILSLNRWGDYEELIMKTSRHMILFYPLVEHDFYAIVVLPKVFSNFGIVKVTLKGAMKELKPFLNL